MNRRKHEMEWDIDRLKPNPRQAALFRPLVGLKLHELADAIRERGFDRPFEVLPDGTIVDGHQRFLAAIELGLKRVPVKVRHDLAADPTTAERYLIETNKHRKHLDRLDEVRVELRLLEIEERVGPGGLDHYDRVSLRHRLAARIGRSTKHVQRLLDIVMGTPTAVQFAVSSGELPIVMATQIARLSPEVRDRIAREIESGLDPKEVVAGYVTEARRNSPDVTRRFASFMNGVDRGLEELDGREGKIYPQGEKAVVYLRMLDRLDGFSARLRPILTRQKAEAEAAVKATKQLRAKLAQAKRPRRR